MFYIQLKRNGRLETVDEFETRQEAGAMLREYRWADPTGVYYVSKRSCGDWNAEQEEK